jgi:hypothetical protein
MSKPVDCQLTQDEGFRSGSKSERDKCGGAEAQVRLFDPAAEARLYAATHACMVAELERQLSDQGYYVPFRPIRTLENPSSLLRNSWMISRG